MSATTHIPFGRTGMDITRIGFGAWAVGGTWGGQDDDDSVEAIRRAVELGVNWIDTAPVYGWGRSEAVVARALQGIPAADRPYVFTKTAPVPEGGDGAFMHGTSERIRAGVEGSLRNLGIERIDLLQMHWPADDDTPVEDYWATLIALREEGKVGHIGLSNHDVAMLDAAEALSHVETLQPPFSAIQRGAAEDVLPWCADHETGVIVYSPMQAGLLTGAFSAERVAALPAQDWRRTDVDFTDGLSANLALAEALRPIADKHDTALGAVAIAWTLAWRGVSAAIVGARSAAQVDGWIAAAELSLDSADLDAVAAAVVATGAGTGPTRP